MISWGWSPSWWRWMQLRWAACRQRGLRMWLNSSYESVTNAWPDTISCTWHLPIWLFFILIIKTRLFLIYVAYKNVHIWIVVFISDKPHLFFRWNSSFATWPVVTPCALCFGTNALSSYRMVINHPTSHPPHTHSSCFPIIVPLVSF